MKKLLFILLLSSCTQEMDKYDIIGRWNLTAIRGLCNDDSVQGVTWEFKDNGILIITDSIRTSYNWEFSVDGECYLETDRETIVVKDYVDCDIMYINHVDKSDLELGLNCDKYYYSK